MLVPAPDAGSGDSQDLWDDLWDEAALLADPTLNAMLDQGVMAAPTNTTTNLQPTTVPTPSGAVTGKTPAERLAAFEQHDTALATHLAPLGTALLSTLQRCMRTSALDTLAAPDASTALLRDMPLPTLALLSEANEHRTFLTSLIDTTAEVIAVLVSHRLRTWVETLQLLQTTNGRLAHEATIRFAWRMCEHDDQTAISDAVLKLWFRAVALEKSRAKHSSPLCSRSVSQPCHSSSWSMLYYKNTVRCPLSTSGPRSYSLYSARCRSTACVDQRTKVGCSRCFPIW